MPSRASDMSDLYRASTYPRRIDYACDIPEYYDGSIVPSSVLTSEIIDLATTYSSVNSFDGSMNYSIMCEHHQYFTSSRNKQYRMRVHIARINDDRSGMCKRVLTVGYHGLKNIGIASVDDDGMITVSGRPHAVDIAGAKIHVEDFSRLKFCFIPAGDDVVFGREKHRLDELRPRAPEWVISGVEWEQNIHINFDPRRRPR